jgi:hypothetical protein
MSSNNLSVELNESQRNLENVKRYDEIVGEEFMDFKDYIGGERDLSCVIHTEHLPEPGFYATRVFITENLSFPRRGLSKIIGKSKKTVRALARLGHPVSNNTYTSKDGYEFNLFSETSKEFLPYAERIGERYRTEGFGDFDVKEWDEKKMLRREELDSIEKRSKIISGFISGAMFLGGGYLALDNLNEANSSQESLIYYSLGTALLFGSVVAYPIIRGLTDEVYNAEY